MAAVDLTLPAVGVSAARVRRAVDRFAEALGLDENTLFALQIAVGEATINAIEHAYRASGGVFTVRLEPVGAGIVVSVQDRGAWRPVERATEPALERERGRGFLLIDGFAQDVRVHRAASGTTVRFVVPLPPSAVV